MKSVAILIDYFGAWPAWMPLFVESCRKNPTIDWYIHTDVAPPAEVPRNVRFIQTTFTEYCRHVSDRLNVRFQPTDVYSVCNVRPMYGVVHREIVESYDFFGWGDLDVVYGDLRVIYTDFVFSHDVISSHEGICSGHLTLFRNVPWLVEAYRHLTGWQARLEAEGPGDWQDSLDEAKLTALLSPDDGKRETFGRLYSIHAPDPSYYRNNFFVEQWSTPFTPRPWLDGSPSHPERWYWTDGKLTNERDGDRQFLYLHLMNFKAKRYVNEDLYESALTWKRQSDYVRFGAEDLAARRDRNCRVRIDRQGMAIEDQWSRTLRRMFGRR